MTRGITDATRRAIEEATKQPHIRTVTEGSRLLLLRNKSGQMVTFGKLYLTGKYLCETLELPWKDNQRKISCIPTGEYRLLKRHSPKFGHHYHLQEVPGRSLILIHTGNTAKDIEGCILVGKRTGHLNGLEAVLSSKDAMALLKAAIDPLYAEGRMVTITIDETAT
jgi:hypothetical protein